MVLALSNDISKNINIVNNKIFHFSICTGTIRSCSEELRHLTGIATWCWRESKKCGQNCRRLARVRIEPNNFFFEIFILWSRTEADLKSVFQNTVSSLFDIGFCLPKSKLHMYGFVVNVFCHSLLVTFCNLNPRLSLGVTLGTETNHSFGKHKHKV